MAQMFAAAILIGGSTSTQQPNLTIAQRANGGRATCIKKDADFGYCEEFLFHSGLRAPFRRSRGVAIARNEAQAIIVCERCEEWLGESIVAELRELLNDFGSEQALILSINDSVGSAAYMLTGGGSVIRYLAIDNVEEVSSGHMPELERKLRSSGLDPVDLVDSMAQLFLPKPFIQFAVEQSFELWVPS